MKAVLISNRPKWCELIVAFKKKVDMRKTRPNIEVPFKVYIYQTRLKWVYNLLREIGFNSLADKMRCGLGKVIGEFVCDQIEVIGFSPYNHGEYICKDQTLIDQSCLTFEEMFDYFGEKYGYAWHISDLVIYDEPKELGEFFKACDKTTPTDCSVCVDHLRNVCKSLKRPPQSWCYVEEVQDG